MASHPSPAQPKRAFPSSLSSARRTSTSAIPSSSSTDTSTSPPKNLLNTSTPTGIPAFRSLRSLLPFGPNKHVTPVSFAVSPIPNVSRSPFSHFGSVRRSMNRERKASLDVELPPVISIDRSSGDEIEESGIRRSVSCSRLEKPSPPEGPQVLNEGRSNPFHDNDDTVVFSTRHAPILRTPSPGPPILADLSTILEADTSGFSKHIPSSSEPSRSPSPNTFTRSNAPLTTQEDPKPNQGLDMDTSILDLSTTHLTTQVLDAMMAEDSNTATQWLNAEKAIIIDRDDTGPDPDTSFNLGALDADLAALLSPHHLPVQSTGTNIKNLTINPRPSSQSRPPIDLSNLSPASPQFNLSPLSPNPILPAPLVPDSTGTTSSGSLRSRLPQQQSSLPRLRPPLPRSPHSPQSPTPSTVLPSSSASDSTRAGDDDTVRTGSPHIKLQRHAPPSPLAGSGSASASAPPSPAGATFSQIAPKPKPTSSPSVSTPTSPSFLSRRFTPQSRSAKTLSQIAPATSKTGPSSSTSTLSRLKAPFTQITTATQRPGVLRTVSTPGNVSDPRPAPSPSPSRLGPRPSLDTTTRGSGSFDRTRQPSLSPVPPGQQFEYETPAKLSLDTLRGAGNGNVGNAPVVLARTRKRSMSVQERFGRHLMGGPRRHGFVGDGDHEHGEEDVRGEFGEQRASSSLSGRLGRRWEGGTDIGGGGSLTGSGNGRAPITEWLGPRTVKAFKAAGLIDFERDQQERSPGSISGLGSSAGSGALGRFASIRSTSEYNPRAPSRMAFSEAGGSSVSRRGSVSGMGVGTAYGLMESPTFTTSSGSRDRDTPRSASTAPTSVSGSSFAMLGRERERDREREEIRELRDKHATETGALLGALSDSQRTTRVLREENGELRERLDQVDAENDALRKVVGDLTKEAGDLRVQVQMLKVSKSASSRLGTGTWSIPARRSGLSTPIYVDNDDEDDDGWGSPVKDKGEPDHNGFGVPQNTTRNSSNQVGRYSDDGGYQWLHGDHLECPPTRPAFSSTPAVPKHRRRFSTTSSIFPVPPANMTMLLHDNDHNDSVSLNGSLDHLQSSPPAPAAMSIYGGKGSVNGHGRNTSITSTTSISPTTANFSMTTGSPGSLFLRPEHEMHLGDMDSLDLGLKRDVNIAVDDDGWSE